MNLIILGISGLCMGTGVIMSECFGAGKMQELKDEMATSLLFGCIAALVIILLGSALTVPILQSLQVPQSVQPATAVYLRIIFLGAPFTYFYNAFSAALKSIGDSKTPLKFLIFSSILNLILDLILIGLLGFGIAWFRCHHSHCGRCFRPPLCAVHIPESPCPAAWSAGCKDTRKPPAHHAALWFCDCTSTGMPANREAAHTGLCQYTGHRYHGCLQCRHTGG